MEEENPYTTGMNWGYIHGAMDDLDPFFEGFQPDLNGEPLTYEAMAQMNTLMNNDEQLGVLMENGEQSWQQASNNFQDPLPTTNQDWQVAQVGEYLADQPGLYLTEQASNNQESLPATQVGPDPTDEARLYIPEQVYPTLAGTVIPAVPPEVTGYQVQAGHRPSFIEYQGSSQSLPVTAANDQYIESPENSPNGEPHLRDPNWTYAIEVWPAYDKPGETVVRDHTAALRSALKSHGVIYHFALITSRDSIVYRQYSLPEKDRFNDRIRLKFLQVFNASKPYNKRLADYYIRMSVVYKSQSILPSGPYPSGIDGDQDLLVYGGSDDVNLIQSVPNSPNLGSASLLGPLTPPETLATPKTDSNRPSRAGPIPKPNRIVTKNKEGKYYCSFPGCSAKTRVFNRKCEWSKHMDKHDRPYKCMAPGCEKLTGFTYPGGLSRHEREVHGKHGGPKNPLYCPHGNCKRHEGKTFSRMENLNEHLRRVHTPNDAVAAPTPEGELDDDSTTTMLAPTPSEKVGEKRKPDTDLREEVKRLRGENEGLRAHSRAMMQEIHRINAQLQALQNATGNMAGLDASPAA
ncbi:hypothetical protein M434DRAFT_13892 [Hypoxylon sp. CO27-5]|nr:hypothetical protein M434DRAFT_13892 [Hypoxylon sp. CO27-5]